MIENRVDIWKSEDNFTIVDKINYSDFINTL